MTETLPETRRTTQQVRRTLEIVHGGKARPKSAKYVE